MRADPNFRGGVAVGQLHAVPPWEALLVRHLRLWCEGPDGRAQVQQEWASSTEDAGYDPALDVFDALITDLLTFARRPLIRHGTACDCLGADECVFAQIVSSASAGHLDDAALMAGLIAMPAHAERIAILAGQVGTAFRNRPALAKRQDSFGTVPARHLFH